MKNRIHPKTGYKYIILIFYLFQGTKVKSRFPGGCDTMTLKWLIQDWKMDNSAGVLKEVETAYTLLTTWVHPRFFGGVCIVECCVLVLYVYVDRVFEVAVSVEFPLLFSFASSLWLKELSSRFSYLNTCLCTDVHIFDKIINLRTDSNLFSVLEIS